MKDTTRGSSNPQSTGVGGSPVTRIRTWTVRTLIHVLSIAVVAAVTVSCGQIADREDGGADGEAASGELADSDNNPQTVEEYAQLCTGSRITDYETTYDLVDALRELLEKWRGVSPPRGLREYHDANIKRIEAMITASRRLPGSQKPHEYMFLPHLASELYAADDERNFVLYDLEPDVRNALRQHECVIE